MHRNSTVIIGKWARFYRALFAVVLGLAVLFNSVHVFAAAGSKHLLQVHAENTVYMQNMSASCCSDHCHNQSCCQGEGCSCMGHCTSVWLSQQVLGIRYNLHKSNLFILAEITPASHINTPPQRPPRA